jgi:hypothetical protein
MPVSADQLNSLVDWVRRNNITSGVGYSLNQTPAGTSISFTSQAGGGGGGGGVAPAACTWRVEDISEPAGGGTLNLKVRVYVDQLRDVNRWPTGTSAEQPYFDIDLNGDYPWWGIYLRVEVDQKNVPLDDPYGIVVREGYDWAKESSIVQVTYIAGVTISNDELGNPYISYIDNYCPNPVIKPAPSCAFLIEDYQLTSGANQKISIRSTAIDRHYPTGMDDTNTYVLDIPDTQNWFAIYAVLITDEVGNIDFETNGVTLGLFSTYKRTSERLTYFLLGEVNLGYDENSNRVITYIYNACAVPFITGGVDWVGNVVPRARGVACRFTIYDNSTLEEQAVIVTAGVVNCIQDYRWPYEMMGGSDYRVGGISTMTYIYVSILYVTNDVVVDPLSMSVRIHVSADLMANDANTEYILLGIVFYDGSKITRIQNFCINATANPCNLLWR